MPGTPRPPLLPVARLLGTCRPQPRLCMMERLFWGYIWPMQYALNRPLAHCRCWDRFLCLPTVLLGCPLPPTPHPPPPYPQPQPRTPSPHPIPKRPTHIHTACLQDFVLCSVVAARLEQGQPSGDAAFAAAADALAAGAQLDGGGRSSTSGRRSQGTCVDEGGAVLKGRAVMQVGHQAAEVVCHPSLLPVCPGLTWRLPCLFAQQVPLPPRRQAPIWRQRRAASVAQRPAGSDTRS